MNTYILAGFGSFCSVFLKGFQYKNVTGNHRKLVFFTSYLMALCDYLIIGIIAKSNWNIAFLCATTASLGMVASMVLHDKIIKKNVG